MITLVDSNVLLDLVTDDPKFAMNRTRRPREHVRGGGATGDYFVTSPGVWSGSPATLSGSAVASETRFGAGE